VLLGICEGMVLQPKRCGFVILRRRTREGVEVVEQDYGDAPWFVRPELWKIGKHILRQWLGGLRRGLDGFDRENGDFLGFPSVEDDEIVLSQIRDGAVFVAGDDTYLNQASGYADGQRLRRVLGRKGNRRQPKRN